MYEHSGALYDAFYDAIGKDYAAEAASVLEAISARRGASPATLLDVACGTGRHLQVFAQSADCVGIDLDATLLRIAGDRCPQVGFFLADMGDFDLGRRFQAVTCLFSSIGYVGTSDRLVRSVARMAAHLDRDGVLVVEPWFGPDEWTDGVVQVIDAESSGTKAVRMMRSGHRGRVSLLDAHYLVAGAAGIEHFTERHELGLFPIEEYVAAFESAGLTPEVDQEGPSGRGLITGVF